MQLRAEFEREQVKKSRLMTKRTGWKEERRGKCGPLVAENVYNLEGPQELLMQLRAEKIEKKR